MNAMFDYSHRDILAARMLHDEIRNLVKAQERGEATEAMSQDIKVLCTCIINFLPSTSARRRAATRNWAQCSCGG